jgi:hypothetical protein
VTVPSLAQMVNRANNGHRRALHRLSRGVPVCGPTPSPGELEGMRTVLLTLVRWGCLQSPDGGMFTLTPRGEALLSVLRERRPLVVVS